MTNIINWHEVNTGGMPEILDALKKLETDLTTLGCRVEIHVHIHPPVTVVEDLAHDWGAPSICRPIGADLSSDPPTSTWDAEEAADRYYGSRRADFYR